MGAYLDRLNSQHDEIRAGIDTLVNRAAEENRDVTDAEQTQVDRDQARLTELGTAIAHYTQIETEGQQVADLRAKVRPAPQLVRSGPDQPAPYDMTDDFPSAGAYAITVHRAMMLKDPEAVEKLERATQHQLLADNPGIVPKPVLGPVINLIDAARPFVQSIKRQALPAGSFDRPYIDQHVAVAVQAAEKTLTASQKMTVLSLPVVAKTYAGHLNISRQDIKWTSPGILQLVFDDFATVYAITTCGAACADFVASITGAAVPISAATGEAVTGALYEGAADALDSGGGLPDTLWVSPDVWASMGGMFNANGSAAFPSLSLTNQGGNPLGLSLVVDQHFPAGTMITGPSRLAEWYEDVDGLMQVGEPDVLGQLVGYAGFAAFLNVSPESFTKFTLPAGP
jgi:hypothetical protein